MTPQQKALVDVQLGEYLGQLHKGVQNDWFGLPELMTPRDPSYNWQESFTHLFESLLSHVQSAGCDLPYEDIRRYLSRAISFFLFDDVEVPSLIWFTGSADDVFLGIAPNGHLSAFAILPSVSHSLWGDPLLETMFMPPDPSQAFLEGYAGGGGGPLLVFPRQKTKRLWYTLFLALVVLTERGVTSSILDDDDDTPAQREWALRTLRESVDILKDAPCY